MALSTLSIRRPVTILMFYAGVAFAGIAGLHQLSVDFLPPVAVPRMSIITTCPNLSPEDVDERVSQPLSSVLGTVPGVTKSSSSSRAGTSLITLAFSWGVDMEFATLGVREKLDQCTADLPREVGRPTILRVDPAAEPIVTIGVSLTSSHARGDVVDLAGLTETCNALLKKRLEQVEGVAQAEVLGGVEREIRVELDETKLMALGLTVEEVARAVHRENVDLPGGTIRKGSLRYPVRLRGELNSATQIARLSFTNRGSGRRIRMTEISTVRDTIEERRGWTRYNGKDIMVLQVRKEAGSNTLAVSENVRQALTRLEREYSGLRLHILDDQAEFIRNSVADVEQSILWGASLAFIVLFLFLSGVRDPCIVGLTMPVSILATLAAMSALDISLNVISLTGLALGIGMLGDNAIIVIENVRRLREAGCPMLQAIETGSREISLAVTASTLTNVAVFLPVLLVRSVAQQLFVDMAITMAVSLLASLLVAVTLVPVLLAGEQHLRRAGGSRSITEQVARYCDAWGRRWLDRMLSHALKSRGLVVISTSVLLAASILVAGMIPSEPAPEFDRKKFLVDLTLGAGTSPVAAAEFAGRIERMLGAMPGVSGVYAAGGIAGNPASWFSPQAALERVHLEIGVAESVATESVMDQTREHIRMLGENLAGVGFALKPGATTLERMLRPQTSDIEIRIQGSDPAICTQIAGGFARKINRLPGLVDLNMASREGGPVYHVRIDRVNAERYGVTPREVADHIAWQTSGGEATAISRVDRKIAVRVQPEHLGSKSIDDLLASHMLCRGVPVPLSQLVRFEQGVGRMEIRREDGIQTVAMTANVSGHSIGAVADDLRRRAMLWLLPAGYSISIGGENEEMEASFRSLILAIGLSILLVYMILAAEYESLLYPFVILLSSPLAFTGAVFAMLLSGEKYNVMSLVGIVIMIGAVDNDAVIAVDVITALRRSGMRLHEAVCRGMCQRLRPIVMTTATTLLGILPLILSPGKGSELVRSLTIPLAGGLVSSALATLVVIPVIFTYIDRWATNKG